MPEEQALDRALSTTGKRVSRPHFPSLPSAQLTRSFQVPICSIPLTSNSASRCFPVHPPTHPAHSAQENQTLLPGRQGETLLSDRQREAFPVFLASLSPTVEVPAGASPESSFLLTGVQARCCGSHPAPEPHNSPTYPNNPVARPLLQGTQWEALPKAIPAEVLL